MAALVAQQGDWRKLTQNLQRPARAAVEAVDAITGASGHRAISPIAARAALMTLTAAAPFDFPSYAEAHFTRHARQTLVMLDAWRALSSSNPTPALNNLHEALAGVIG